MSDPFVGEIRLVAFYFAPTDWAFCNGQTLPIAQYLPLFTVMGTQYGGDGITTFAVPDLRGRAPISFGTSLTGTAYVQGYTGGEETHTLATNEIPQHVHPLIGDNSTPATSNFAQPSGACLGAVQARQTPGAYIPFALYSDGAATGTLDSRALSSNSGGQSHENMQPYLVMNHIIALKGIFPSRV